MTALKDRNKTKTILITGGCQGIGQAIAYRFGAEGFNIVLASKDTPDKVKETVDGVIKAGGYALPCDSDVRDYQELENLVLKAVEQFGSLDILVNNTSAPCFNDTLHTSPEEYDLAQSTSVRAAFFLSKLCYPYLKEGTNSHIINISPPLNLEEEWLRDYLPFALGKYGMSLCTKGMAAEFRVSGIAVNSLWPQTNIATPRLKEHLSRDVYAGSRLPSIMADAAYALSQRTFKEASGQFFIDETLLRETGVTDFSHYAVDPNRPLVQTLFLPLKDGMMPISRELFQCKKISST
ncbi:SDR family oxidoreductase [Criblamydia sequanensis]|uniref:Short-chain dehydrogenase/reductase n=1 Tax=Candidatus Criblamydia sequanensis CRIB-18 TaxID=1437425 RepID=A0A090D2R6_9BACT|nr:SDR family oxidoreductase [Criblamydia sequanensis]CDR34865.1 Short-chain dehydrogenase/reductase [Criblamydia sequanensis CRIB-18]